MGKIVVVSDVHGNYEGLERALIQARVINEKGNRITDADNRAFVISIGDLANCVEDSIKGDVACLNTVGNWIDLMLMGNHEHPYFGGPAFSGWYYNEYVFNKLQNIEAAGNLKPCYLRRNTLISHAGWDKENHPYISTAKEAFDYIMEAYNSRGWTHHIFTRISYNRGGRDKHGGILWEDFRDLRSPFPQIVGHTSDNRLRYKENALCIDTQKSSGAPTVLDFWF